MASKVDKLRDIWEGIPKVIMSQEFSNPEEINRYMELFHFGECFYVIFNTHTAEMEFVHPNVQEMTGYQPKEFGLSLVLEKIHPDDLPYYFHYEQSAVRFFSALPPEFILSYKFSYDYQLKTRNGNYKRFLQQIVPLGYFAEGGARTLGIFTDLTHLNIQGIPKLSFIGMNGAPSYYNVHLQDEFLLSQQLFTKKEREILELVILGFTSDAIAKRLGRSIFTIRNHRKNILEKSGCGNIQELLVKSVREGWV